MKKENTSNDPTERIENGTIRLLVPIKSFDYGVTVQDILFANKDLPFESITFLHIVENELLDTPLYTHTEAISRLRGQDRKQGTARAFLDEIAARVKSFVQAEVRSDVIVAEDISDCIIEQAKRWQCNLAILLADTSSLNESWFSKSVLKTVLKKAPSDLHVHVIRPAAGDGLSFGLKLR
ncbi:MAG: hypothetical protein Q8T09_01240 [Candidatus Melainabacteria bacterium]|nr:hypothetical protein [Candidatus Melainabacteria bacterium]